MKTASEEDIFSVHNSSGFGGWCFWRVQKSRVAHGHTRRLRFEEAANVTSVG
jgi:hypothetical protein